MSLVSHGLTALLFLLFTLARASPGHTPMSTRMARTEPPHIEDVCDQYADLPDLVMLALGSVYWTPPEDALQDMVSALSQTDTHKYGAILGEPPLRAHLTRKLAQHGLHMDNLDVVVTAGANQAFANIALCLLDPEDDVIILAPYYFSHKMACAISGARVHVCGFDKGTMGPDWGALKEMVASVKPKMVWCGGVGFRV
jgi:aspartate/methionine/tyrosine aminotransferase